MPSVKPVAASVSNSRNPASSWGSRSPGWRLRPSTCRTGSWRTSAISPCDRRAASRQSSALAGIDAERRAAAILSGGDDYELAFTASPANRDAVLAAAREAGVAVTRIGEAVAGPAVVRVLDARGFDIAPARGGFDHFG